MDKVLRPERFSIIPSEENATKRWRHWFKTFENYLTTVVENQANNDRLMVLINYVTSEVFELLFNEAENYEEAINILKSLYIKTPNEIFARHALATRKQQPDESIDEYLQILKIMSKDCNFQQVTANQYRDEAVRDAFISDLLSNAIRQRLLENKTLYLETAFDQAGAGVGMLFTQRPKCGKTVEAAGRTMIGKQGEDFRGGEITVYVRM